MIINLLFLVGAYKKSKALIIMGNVLSIIMVISQMAAMALVMDKTFDLIAISIISAVFQCWMLLIAYGCIQEIKQLQNDESNAKIFSTYVNIQDDSKKFTLHNHC